VLAVAPDGAVNVSPDVMQPDMLRHAMPSKR
jgi:hypothetical protein